MTMNNRFHTIRFALVMTVTACVSGCIDIPQQSNTSYDTITLSRKSVSIPESWSATLFGKNDVTITPQTTGQLMQVCVSEGERVKKGQKLFIIDQRQAFNALETAKANLEAAKAQLSTAQLEQP